MTNQGIYTAALRLACEAPGIGENPDYADRSCSLLAVICLRYADLDAAYRKAHGLEPAALPEDGLSCSMCAPFPLSAVFAAPASASLASMLVMDENPALSDRLRSLCDESVSAIRQSLPYQPEAIVEKYSFGR